MAGTLGEGVNPILNVLQNTDQILNVTLIATLAGLSLMAAALAFGPLRENIDKSHSKLKELKQYYHTNDLKNRIEENIKKLEENLISANKCGKNLINASCFFIIAFFLIFVFDTYGELYTENLCFELMDVIITGSLSIV